ncbi:MAG TPA: phytanoyl-CoA dioxygenase family protein [Woeseiaceae bacterium]|nr:phytanoyl-CoA dioxygenase family protein [Woeseiaceae bacterium]
MVANHEAVTELPRYRAPEDGQLSDEMLHDFRRQGCLILTDFVPATECRKLKARARELIDRFDPSSVKSIFSAMEQTQLGDSYFEESGDKIRFFFEKDAFDSNGQLQQSKEDSLNKIGHAMHDLDPVFDAFSRTAKLEAVVNSLEYETPVILQSMYILKPPRIGGEVYCHQDSTFLYTEPESCTGFWFALEDATIDNGCMHFIPGAHRGPLKELHHRGSDGKMGFKTLDHTPWPKGATRPAEATAGTLVIFDGRAPHMSGPNRSARSRHAYTIHVIDKNSHYPAGNWLQRGPDLPLRGFD